MDRLHACGIVLVGGLDQLRNAFVAVRQGPVLGQVVGIVGRSHPLVGGGYPAPGAVVLRRLVVRQPALPVVPGVPARRRRHAPDVVGRVSHGRAACGLEADVALVIGRHHVLHRRVIVRQGREQRVHRFRLVGLQARQHRLVVGIERAPAQRQHVFAEVQHVGMRFLGVAQHGAVPRAAHLQGNIGLPFHADGFVAHREGRPALGRAVLRRVGGVDLLQVQVLHVRARVGEAPGHFVRAAQHHERHAGQGSTHRVNGAHGSAVRRLACGRLQARKVPDGGCRQAQVRVVGQQRFATHGAGARQHPVVAALALVGARIAGQLVGPGQHAGTDLAGQRSVAQCGRCSLPVGQRCSCGRCSRRVGIGGAVHPQLPVQRGQVGRGCGALARVRRHQLPQALGVQRFGDGQPRKLVAPVATQVQRHHQRPAYAVFRLPHGTGGPTGLNAQDVELRRQRLGAVLVEGVDALAVGLQGLPGIQRQACVLPLGRAHDVQRAHELVGLQRGGPEHLGQLAMHHAAVELQLPGALLSMYVAHGKPGILRALRADVGHIGAIALHLYGLAQALDHQLAIQRRKAALHIHGSPRASQQGRHHQPDGRSLHPRHVSCLLIVLGCLCWLGSEKRLHAEQEPAALQQPAATAQGVSPDERWCQTPQSS